MARNERLSGKTAFSFLGLFKASFKIVNPRVMEFKLSTLSFEPNEVQYTSKSLNRPKKVGFTLKIIHNELYFDSEQYRN